MFISRSRLSSGLITFALIILGLFSETTPSAFSSAEAALFILLATPYFLLDRLMNNQVYYVCSVLLLLIFLGIIGSMKNDVEFSYLARDLIPFLFFFTIILIAALDEENNIIIIMYGMLFVGIAFSLRYIFSIDMQLVDIGGKFFNDKHYLMQDPACLFAALFSINRMFWCLKKGQLLLTTVFLMISLLITLAFLLMGIRAALGITIFYTLILIWCHVRSNVLILIINCFFIYCIYMNVWIFELIIQKFYDSGLNNKDVEALAVIEYVTAELDTLLLGVGFGGTFYNPVYAEYIRYTHNFITYNLLKFGIVGLFIATAVLMLHIYILCGKLLNAILHKRIDTYTSVSLAMIPSMYLQPTFKSLTFGILFSLFLVRGLGIDRRCNTYP